MSQSPHLYDYSPDLGLHKHLVQTLVVGRYGSWGEARVVRCSPSSWFMLK